MAKRTDEPTEHLINYSPNDHCHEIVMHWPLQWIVYCVSVCVMSVAVKCHIERISLSVSPSLNFSVSQFHLPRFVCQWIYDHDNVFTIMVHAAHSPFDSVRAHCFCLYFSLSRRLHFFISFSIAFGMRWPIDARTQSERDRQMQMLMLVMRHRPMTPCVRIRNIVRWRWWRSSCIVPSARSHWHCVFARNMRQIYWLYPLLLRFFLLKILLVMWLALSRK